MGDNRTHLLVNVGDGLLALPVHVEDLQERLVDPFVIGEPSLREARVMRSASALLTPSINYM